MTVSIAADRSWEIQRRLILVRGLIAKGFLLCRHGGLPANQCVLSMAAKISFRS
jgi:hypothetical protein